jgi:nitric oxide dioxygenase
MPRALSETTIATVKATVPVLEAHGLDIVRAMYAHMFQNPEIKALFNQSHHSDEGSQPRALAGAILAYAQNIDNLGVLTPTVERIAQKHVGLQILPEHYPHVADALLAAIEEVLGDAATPNVLSAWGEAYWFLADILIGREASLYRELETAEGGWSGWRNFTVVEVRRESETITSFVLRPSDGKAVIRHRPGQYLTFWLDMPGQGPLKRNYSISSAPNGKTYRISVKREPYGIVSNWLHDHATPGTELRVAPPAGDFYLPERVERPVVLLSGGVGLTPMLAMLETVAERRPDFQTHYVHGALNGAFHAMGPAVRSLAEKTDNMRVTTFYEAPRADDVPGRDFDRSGRIDGNWLRSETPVAEAEYYLCGPKPFMRAMVSELSACGVPAERIRYEFFGPADELLAA